MTTIDVLQTVGLAALTIAIIFILLTISKRNP